MPVSDQYWILSVIWISLHFFVLTPYFRNMTNHLFTEHISLSLLLIQTIHIKAVLSLFNVSDNIDMSVKLVFSVIFYLITLYYRKRDKNKNIISDNIELLFVISSILLIPGRYTFTILLPVYIAVKALSLWNSTKSVFLSFVSLFINFLFLFLIIIYSIDIVDRYFHGRVLYKLYFFEMTLILFAILPFLKEFRTKIRKLIDKKYSFLRDIGPYALKDIPFDPLKDVKKPLDAVIKALPDIGMFKVSLLIIKNAKNMEIYDYNSEKNQVSMKLHLTNKSEIYKTLDLIRDPATSFYADQLFSSTAEESRKWHNIAGRYDFIIPVEDKGKVVLYLTCSVSSGINLFEASLEMDQIFQIKRFLELIFKTTAVLKEEIDLKSALEVTQEHKENFETMLEQVEEVNKAYKDLQEKQEQLLEAERWISLSRMTVTLNHEINNPLTLILGMGQLLSVKLSNTRSLDENEFIKSLNTILPQIKRIVSIVESMRKISVPEVENYMPDIEMIKLDLKRDGND